MSPIFPDTNLLSVTVLAEQLNDDTGTWIKTSRYEFTFIWDSERFTRTTIHPNFRLLQLQVSDNYSIFTSFYTFFEKAGVVFKINDTAFLCGTTIQEDNFIDTTLPKIVPPPSNKDQIKSSKSIFRNEQQAILTRDVHYEIVALTSVDIDMNYMVPSYSIRLKNSLTISVTKYYLTTVIFYDIIQRYV